MNQIVNQVQSTNEHSIFTDLIGNRPINENHVARLVISMKQSYLQVPLIVNEKMEIIDGQHRLKAHKELNLPTYFIENKGYGLEETQLLNQNSNNWTANDFMHGYCNAGKNEYLKYRVFNNKYRLNHQCQMNLLKGTISEGKWYESFRAGTFKITHLKKAEKIANAILEIGEYYDGYKRRSFVSAMQRAIACPEYNHAYFIKKLKHQRAKMIDCSNYKQYLVLMEKIYNFKSKKDNRIRLYTN